MSNVISMADFANNATYVSPEQALESAMERVKEAKTPKVLILLLDDATGDYNVGFRQAGMKCSEMVALLEVFKQTMLQEMGY